MKLACEHEPHCPASLSIDRACQCAMDPVPGDPFDMVLNEIQKLNQRKRADYTNGEDPWQNFKDSATQVGQMPGLSVEVLIGTKQARLKQLLFSGRDANNESVRDSLLDRAVYAVIALAMYDEGHYS